VKLGETRDEARYELESGLQIRGEDLVIVRTII
jgi:hypothetical protein